MRISDWSSDVCSSDLKVDMKDIAAKLLDTFDLMIERQNAYRDRHGEDAIHDIQYDQQMRDPIGTMRKVYERFDEPFTPPVEAAMQKMMAANRSEEHTSELQSLMRISYAVFCLKKKKT